MKSTLYEQWEKIHGASSKPYIAMIDVETLGLYGPAVAFGISVWQKNGFFKTERVHCVSEKVFKKMLSKTTTQDCNWFMENVYLHLKDQFEESSMSHYDFMEAAAMCIAAWINDADLWGDCIFPVETNFLSKLIADGHLKANESPYPLYDLSTLLNVNVSRAHFAGMVHAHIHDPGVDAYHSAAALFKETDFPIV